MKLQPSTQQLTFLFHSVYLLNIDPGQYFFISNLLLPSCVQNSPKTFHLMAAVLLKAHGEILWKLHQAQPTKIYLDVSVSIRGLRQKNMELILLPVLATVVMWRGKKSVVLVAQCVATLIPVH